MRLHIPASGALDDLRIFRQARRISYVTIPASIEAPKRGATKVWRQNLASQVKRTRLRAWTAEAAVPRWFIGRATERVCRFLQLLLRILY